MGQAENVLRLDLHALIPRFAPLRLRDAARLGRLVASIEQQGQLMPVVAVSEAGGDHHWVLIDGYRRLEALQRLGADRIWVDVWERSVDEALLGCLARGPDRAWEAIEEAALIAELAKRHSLQAIAQQLGRDVSWVSRRLRLLKDLPEDLLEQVRQGRISVWAATRILAPLARANSDHARTLLDQLEHQPLSAPVSSSASTATTRRPTRLSANAWWRTPGCFLRPCRAGNRRAPASAWQRVPKGLGAKT